MKSISYLRKPFLALDLLFQGERGYIAVDIAKPAAILGQKAAAVCSILPAGAVAEDGLKAGMGQQESMGCRKGIKGTRIAVVCQFSNPVLILGSSLGVFSWDH